MRNATGREVKCIIKDVLEKRGRRTQEDLMDDVMDVLKVENKQLCPWMVEDWPGFLRRHLEELEGTMKNGVVCYVQPEKVSSAPIITELMEKEEKTAMVEQRIFVDMEIPTREISCRAMSDAERKWGYMVKNLPLLMYILKEFYEANGAVSVWEYRKELEAFIRGEHSSTVGVNWDLFGIEYYKIFKLQLVVQHGKDKYHALIVPNMLILRSAFHPLPVGLLSELYKFLLSVPSGEARDDAILKHLIKYTWSEVISAAKKHCSVFCLLEAHYIKLINNRPFFVVCDIHMGPSKYA